MSDALGSLTHNILLLHNVAAVGQPCSALGFARPRRKRRRSRRTLIGGVSHDVSRDKCVLNMAADGGKYTGYSRTMAPRTFLAVFATVSLLCGPAAAEVRSVVLDKQSGQLSVVEGLKEDFVAWANFTDDIKASG